MKDLNNPCIFCNIIKKDIIFDKSLKIKELWEQGSIFSLRLFLGSALVGLSLASISGVIVFLLYKRKVKKGIF